jgi:hypothetical protein
MSNSKKRRYGGYSTAYGAAGLLAAYALAMAGVVPESDIPFLAEAIGTVIGAFAGCVHAYITE